MHDNNTSHREWPQWNQKIPDDTQITINGLKDITVSQHDSEMHSLFPSIYLLCCWVCRMQKLFEKYFKWGKVQIIKPYTDNFFEDKLFYCNTSQPQLPLPLTLADQIPPYLSSPQIYSPSISLHKRAELLETANKHVKIG